MTKCSAENLSISVGVNNRISTAGYVYDAAGNLTTNATDGVTATYDAESRIATVAKSGVTTAYVYDSDGNRVKKSNGSTGTLYWYATTGMLAESDLAGSLQHEYVFLNGRRVARHDAGSGVYYFFSDHLNTANVMTDSAGNIKHEADYYPWGGELTLINAADDTHKFTDKERDAESGIDYFGGRYYSNGLARFMTPDWAPEAAAVPYAEFVDPQSLNLYTYVRNVPTSRLDPDGHEPQRPRRPPAEEEEMNRREEEAENRELERAREEVERDKLKEEAHRAAEAREKFAKEHADGYDDPDGVCHVGPPSTSSVGPAGPSSPPQKPPVFVEMSEFVPGGKAIGLLGNPGSRGIPIFSGTKGPAQLMPKGTPGFNGYTSTHVEGHAAALMRISGIKNATLLINKPAVCGACSQNLPHMLPPGSTLRVVLSTGQSVEFHGNPR